MHRPSRCSSFLVVAPQRIGDVLLVTPLIRSLRRGFPGAEVDALVFEGTEAVLAGNPDLRRVVTVPRQPSLQGHLSLLGGLLRRYDVALSTIAGDRPTLYASVAGRWRAGVLLDRPKHAWKRLLLDRWLPFDLYDTHTVRSALELVEPLGVARCFEVVVAWSSAAPAKVDAVLGEARASRLAVIHPHPKFNYKQWHLAGWEALARWLHGRGFRVVLSGGPDAEEIGYVAALQRRLGPDALNLCGQLGLDEIGCLLSRAALYVGPDTATTHMAAAAGAPTVALYGPTNPVKWGPWPAGFAEDRNPWQRVGSGRVGNVFLVQGEKHCVPCMQEGCDRHTASFSDCLQELAPERVIAACAEMLGCGTMGAPT